MNISGFRGMTKQSQNEPPLTELMCGKISELRTSRMENRGVSHLNPEAQQPYCYVYGSSFPEVRQPERETGVHLVLNELILQLYLLLHWILAVSWQERRPCRGPAPSRGSDRHRMLRYCGAPIAVPPGCRAAPGSRQPLPRGPARVESGGNLQHQEREMSVTDIWWCRSTDDDVKLLHSKCVTGGKISDKDRIHNKSCKIYTRLWHGFGSRCPTLRTYEWIFM